MKKILNEPGTLVETGKWRKTTYAAIEYGSVHTSTGV
jgi:hypothetical protein